nr:MAG TPA: hypothetical protein [Caudoviricetes sp.]
MENLGKFSVSNVVDSAPSGSLGVALVPNGGSYSMMATKTVGGGGGGQGGNVPKLGESDTAWQEQSTVRGTWMYRRYNGILFIKGPGKYSQIPGGAPASNLNLFRLPEGVREGVQVTVAPLFKAGNPPVSDGSLVRVDDGGNISITVTSNSAYIVPTITVPVEL